MVSSGIPGLREFLADYPLMAVRPSPGSMVVLRGEFAFTASATSHGEVANTFELSIEIPPEFPQELPRVREVGGKLPRVGAYHVYPDGTLCLGSPIRLLAKLSRRPTLVGFVEQCLVPYLFAVSLKLASGGVLVFDELPHGPDGVLDDYIELFGLKTYDQVRAVLRALGMKKRHANKLPCPCLCGRRLGKCAFNYKIKEFRTIASRSWYRRQAMVLRVPGKRVGRQISSDAMPSCVDVVL